MAKSKHSKMKLKPFTVEEAIEHAKKRFLEAGQSKKRVPKLPPFGTKRTGEKSREVGREIRLEFLKLLDKLRDEFVNKVENEPSGAGAWSKYKDEYHALLEFITFARHNREEES